MPTRVQWEAGYGVEHEAIDTQHRSLLDQCNLLADCCLSGDDEESDRNFDQAFDRLKALVREHFATEASLLASHGYPDLKDHRFECDEFEYLAEEIVTTENFVRLELQWFLARWCIGHFTGSAEQQRAFLAGGNASIKVDTSDPQSADT
jgi:hemerythrin-like metal-binding protein